MKRLFVPALLAVLAAAPAFGQQRDYLTPEEVELAREAQEPNKRIELFLKFAAQRLLAFEQTLATPSDAEAPRPWQLKDKLNDFIRAADDVTDNLERAVDRGGVDLGKGRGLALKQGEEFSKRLKLIQDTYELAKGEDLQYDMQDATEAVESLLEVAKKIPGGVLPARVPADVAGAPEKEPPPPSGKPSLKRREKPKEDKPN